jgi:hypothetical protein
MKYNLKDVTFLFLIRIDTIERLENLLVSTSFLVSTFNTNIEVLEVSSYNNEILKKLLHKTINYTFIKDDDPILYRTKYLNRMLSHSKTPFVAVWDADVIAPSEQIIESINLLRRKEAEFVYPYTGKFLDTSLIIRKLYFENLDINFLARNSSKMKEMYPPRPVGGAFACKLDVYKDVGLENEEFYGWGVEDGDRYLRWDNSKYKIERVKGILFHLSHPRGINSVFHNYDQSYVKLRILEASARKVKLSNIKIV